MGLVSLNKKGQGLLITAMVIVIAVLVLAILYRVFTMTPAYVYQRSIYYAFKENPQIVVQQLDEEIQAIVATFAINYSNALINEGLYLYLHALTQSPVSYSLASVIGAQINILVNSIYVPTGIAIPTTKPKPHVSITTGFYGALKIKGVKYIYSAGNESSIAVKVNDTYNMPTLGIQNLTLRNGVSLTAWIATPQNPSTLNPTTITTETRCIFNFTQDNYTCTGPATYTTGNASYLWAPYNQAYQQGDIYWASGTGWVAGGQTASLAFALPIDELAANSGFKISATFNIANCTAGQQVCAGIQFLAPWPTQEFSNPQGYSVVITPSSVELYYGSQSQPLECLSQSNGVVNLINLTVYVQPTEQITWQNIKNNEPQANLYVYINGSQCGTPTTINLPGLFYVSSTVFGNSAYMLSGLGPNGQLLGSWVAIILQNAAVINASIKLYNNYTLPRNVLVAVSYNNAPALGASIIGLNVTPTLGYSEINLTNKYLVYNITSNAVVFNVAMPWPPKGYPNTQYLLLIDYSNIRLILNPWSPAALSAMGINSGFATPSGYSATSLIPYMAFIYNQTSGSLIEVTYFINTGVPTALTIYGGGTGLYITNIINGQVYAALGTVEPLPWMNIFKVNNAYPMGVLSILTFNESIYNLAPGYAVIGQIIPPSESSITGFGNTYNYPYALYNWITEYEHFPNQTLPYAYVYPTIMNCQYQSYENSYIYFTYTNGQLLYNGYTQLQQLYYGYPSNLASCTPQQESWGW